MKKFIFTILVCTIPILLLGQPSLVIQKGHRPGIEALSFSDNGKVLVSVSMNVKTWNLANGLEISNEKIRGNHPKFFNDGKNLALCKGDSIFIWKRAGEEQEFIFKGFPRTIVQAYIVDGLLKKMNSNVTQAIEIKVSQLEAMKRLGQRSKTDRSRLYDMDTQTIVSRLEEYEQKTMLARNFYEKRHLLQVVDGDGSEDEVFERICSQIDETLRNAF